MDGLREKCRGVGGMDRVVMFLNTYGLLKSVQEQVGCWAWIRLVIGFIIGHFEIRSLTEIWNRFHPDYCRVCCDAEQLKTMSTSSVTVKPLVGWGPLAGTSLRVWILCQEMTSRLFTGPLLAWTGWEVLGLNFWNRFILKLVWFRIGTVLFPDLISYKVLW